MPHFRMVETSLKRAELKIDEIILRKDDKGEVTHSLSLRNVTEIPEELVDEAKRIAGRLGYKLQEAEPPEEGNAETRQQVGDDVVGMSPVNVGSGGGQAGSAAGTDQPSDAPSQTPSNAPSGTPAPAPGTTPSTSGGGTSTQINP